MSLQLKVVSIKSYFTLLDERAGGGVYKNLCDTARVPAENGTSELKLIEFENDKVECGKLFKMAGKDE